MFGNKFVGLKVRFIYINLGLFGFEMRVKSLWVPRDSELMILKFHFYSSSYRFLDLFLFNLFSIPEHHLYPYHSFLIPKGLFLCCLRVLFKRDSIWLIFDIFFPIMLYFSPNIHEYDVIEHKTLLIEDYSWYFSSWKWKR